MTHTPQPTSTPIPTSTPTRGIRRLLVLGLIVVLAVTTAVLVHQARKGSSSSPFPAKPSSPSAAAPSNTSRGGQPGGSDEADGVVPDGVTVFDEGVPAVANLDPGLLDALRRAASDAADDRVEFHVNSGWRSPEYQKRLLREAVAKYGSEKEAARWVATPETSPHVSGDAIDIGPTKATTWLSEHGARYGLCRVFKNEPWHYELRPTAIDAGCPRMYADAGQDPRMRR